MSALGIPEWVVVAVLVAEIDAAVVSEKQDERVVVHALVLQRLRQVAHGFVHDGDHCIEDAAVRIRHSRVQVLLWDLIAERKNERERERKGIGR